MVSDMVGAETGAPVTVTHVKAAEGDPSRRRPDISLAKEVLDWEPRVSVVEGIRKTITYFQAELSLDATAAAATAAAAAATATTTKAVSASQTDQPAQENQ